jgi:ParB-like chromosome segregation protein Spo0J
MTPSNEAARRNWGAQKKSRKVADGVEAVATTAGDLPDTEHSGEPLDHDLTPTTARHQADRLTAALLPPHPLGDLFPLIEGDEFEELVASIKAHGLRDPITIQDGMVLDGRNRQLACQAAGVRCDYQPLPVGQDPLTFVIDKNLNRRHLTISQRAMVAAKLANLKDGQTKAGTQICVPVSQEDAAERLKVSQRSVQSATKVKDDAAPELIQAVERGDVTVSVAAEIAELPQAEQRKVVAKGPTAIKTKAKELRTSKRPVGKKNEAKAELSILAWSEAKLDERRHFLDGVGLQPLREAIPPSWRVQLDDLPSDDEPKLAKRDFLEFARETTLRARRYSVRGLVADKGVIDAASDAASALATLLTQLKSFEAQVSARVKSIPEDLSIPDFLKRAPAESDEQSH